MDESQNIQLTRIDGSLTTFGEFRGKVVLIVNTASRCEFTSQYAEMEALYRQYKDQGLVVLGFPCNQFRAQESGTDEDIRFFCESNYGVTFPLFSKIEVNGPQAHPLFAYLKKQAPGIFGTEGIKWNFTKFLVAADGSVQGRYAPNVQPRQLANAIEAQLTRN